MVSDSLREVMLAGEGAGRLEGPDVVTAAAEHPVCGDEIDLDCRIAGGRIVDLAWRARGCPATMAVVAVARRALLGVRILDADPHALDLREAEDRMWSRLQELGGLAKTECHALAMLLRALAKVSAP